MNIYQNKQTRNLIDHSYRKKGIKDNFGSFRLTKLDRSKKMVSKHKNNKRLCTKQRSKSAYILTLLGKHRCEILFRKGPLDDAKV